ncbi:OmpA family protein [Pontibacter chinhatensis]|uniref:OmpA family protein n=1 Tax=Pontibacter chinhatensis TaxID=1436961 RepID=A0A1I2ZUL8_9BACT|nr:OmpA family protein [Pontibacter chinhatensis]SFH41484.1 OmpA family protein [Pontibacter chinhatensis]
MSKQSRDFFWPSYVDLMTVLFLVMLVLFVLSFKLFQDKDRENRDNIARLQVEVQEKRKLDEIKAALSRLDDKYFQYNEQYKRHELLVDVLFEQSSAEIPQRARAPLRRAGENLSQVINSIEEEDVKYLIVIDGRAASFPKGDPRNITQREYALQLSYQRALALLDFWQDQGIKFPRDRVELIAAGSGFEGAGRKGDIRDRRFVIQILPKVGALDVEAR